MELYKIAVRVVFVYLFLYVLLRISGKRTVGQTSPLDFVLALIVGDMLDDAIWAEVSISQFVAGAGTLVMTGVSVSMGSYASDAFARIACGRSNVIVRDGSPVRREMRVARMNEKELEEMLRQAEGLGRPRWSEVKIARIEKRGQPSVIKHDWAKPVQRQDAARLPGKETR